MSMIESVMDLKKKNGNPASGEEKGKTKRKYDLRSFIIVFALIAIWAVLQIVTEGTFLSARNLSLLFRQMSIIAVIAVGMVLVIVAGHVDLSVGSIVAFCGAVSAIMQVQFHMGTVPSIIVPLIIGILFGAWNGFWASYQKVPAFIVTLGSMLLFRGFTLIITGGQTISSLDSGFRFIAEGYIAPIIGYIITAIAAGVYIFLEIKNAGK